MKTCKPYTEAEDDLLRELYPRTRARDIAVRIGRSERSVVARAFKLGLKKDADFMYECSKAGQFKNGHTPHNKGKEWAEYLSEETMAKVRRTTFKKGHMPTNHKEVGSERITKDGYTEIKVAEPNVWMLKHVYVWEQHHGKVGEGMVVYFKDGNKSNITIENLAITDRVGHANNTIHNVPIEFKQLWQLQGALKRQINKHDK